MQSLMGLLWRQASKVASEVKKLKGGRQQAEYLQKEKKLELQRGDVLKGKEVTLQQKLSSVNKENANIARAEENKKN